MSLPTRHGRRRILIVTAEFHALFKNGGIGTANTGLALTLAGAGHDVTVAYVDSGLVDLAARRAAAADAVEAWAKRGIRLEFVPRCAALRAGHEDHVAASFAVLEYLRGRDFEIVFFNECGGQGYYSLLAKRAGLLPDAPRMIVVTHGANAWVLELNAQLYWSLHPVSVDHLERRSAELADDLISPSQYLLTWMEARGWALPASTRVVQNALPVEPSAPRAAAEIEEIVFFGRLEARKGVDLFLAAYARLIATRDMSRVKVTFLGKFSRIDGVHSGVYVLERTRAWPAAPTLLTELGQEEALAYLSRPGVLAIMPSRAENSPCVVAECLIAGVPFIATDSGGTSELIAAGDRARTLCALVPESLAQKIAAALDHGAGPAAPAISQSEIRRTWLELVDEAPAPAKPAPAHSPVSLCFAEPPQDWESFLAQDFAEIIVVADDAARLPDDPRIRRFAEPGLDRARALNLAARQAHGPWLMFADEREVVLKPKALAGLLGVARGLQAEIVTSPSLTLSHAGPPRAGWDGFIGHLPSGANLTLAAFENCLGEACFLMDRARFLEIGGYGAQASDWLLLSQAALAGAKLEVAAEPLFWRREPLAQIFNRDAAPAERRRVLKAFVGATDSALAPALEIVAAGSARDRAGETMAGLGADAAELALKLSRLPQRDGVDQNRPFLEYCLLRGRRREALAFARGLDDPALLRFAEAGVAAAAERAALGLVRAPAPREVCEVALIKIAAERAQALAGLAQEELRRGEDEIAYPARSAVSVVKIARICPPGVRRLLAKVSGSERVALVVCDRFAALHLDGEDLSATAPFAWTGWRAPGDLALDLAEPFAEAADVYWLAQGATCEPVVWSALDAEVALFDFETPSRLALAATPLPRRLLAAAELLTPAPEFSGPYFVAGSPTLHHPLVGRAALVRVAGAAFSGSTGVVAVFGLEHPQSRPVEFALWVRPMGETVSSVEALGDSLHFSGWTAVRAAFRDHRAEIAFPAPLGEPHDLYLATRVIDFPDNSYCHAVWREIAVLGS